MVARSFGPPPVGLADCPARWIGSPFSEMLPLRWDAFGEDVEGGGRGRPRYPIQLNRDGLYQFSVKTDSFLSLVGLPRRAAAKTGGGAAATPYCCALIC